MRRQGLWAGGSPFCGSCPGVAFVPPRRRPADIGGGPRRQPARRLGHGEAGNEGTRRSARPRDGPPNGAKHVLGFGRHCSPGRRKQPCILRRTVIALQHADRGASKLPLGSSANKNCSKSLCQLGKVLTDALTTTYANTASTWCAPACQ